MAGLRAVLLAAILPALVIPAGCNSAARYRVIDQGETVAIGLSSQAVSRNSRVANQTIITDTSTGLASGALVGAAWGLSCGPFFWFCSPLGALAGATTGATAGLIVGVIESLPREQAEAIATQLSDYLAQNNPESGLLDAVNSRAGETWSLVMLPADRQFELRILELGLRSYRNERIALAPEVEVVLSYPGPDNEPATLTRQIGYESATAPAQSWLENQRDFIPRQFATAFVAIAEELVVSFQRQSVSL